MNNFPIWDSRRMSLEKDMRQQRLEKLKQKIDEDKIE